MLEIKCVLSINELKWIDMELHTDVILVISLADVSRVFGFGFQIFWGLMKIVLLMKNVKIVLEIWKYE